MQNDDAFFEVVKDLVVADSYRFRVHEDHADPVQYEVGEEEVASLPDAANDNINGECRRDFLTVEKAGGGDLG